MKGPSPLLGYNTNVRHGGKVFHIQTEDSGLKHPHIITHLFADGGRIIASKKTSYAEMVGDANVQDLVKKMMREQHKGMFIALRDGVYDEESELQAPAVPAGRVSDRTPPPAAGGSPTPEADPREQAPARLTGAEQPAAASPGAVTTFQSTRPGSIRVLGGQTSGSIFGSDLLSEKSLDEVILSYLAEDLEEDAP